MNLLSQHLTRLTDFSGRENRKPFWLWMLIVYGFQFAIGVVASVPLTMRMMNTMQPLMTQDQSYLDSHPEVASKVMMTAMAPFMHDLLLFSVAAGLVYIALIAAAVVRRLHDGNRSGWWAAPVLAIQIALLASYWTLLPRFFTLMGSAGPDTTPEQLNEQMSALFPAFALVGLLGFVGFVVGVGLIVLLALRGTTGPNRYGPDLLPPPSDPVAGQPWTAAPDARPGHPARIVGPWDDQGPRA